MKRAGGANVKYARGVARGEGYGTTVGHRAGDERGSENTTLRADEELYTIPTARVQTAEGVPYPSPRAIAAQPIIAGTARHRTSSRVIARYRSHRASPRPDLSCASARSPRSRSRS